MGKLDLALYNLKKLDALAYQDTIIHRIDPRIKVITTLVFILGIVSFNKYRITQLLPFFFYPVYLLYSGNIPFFYIFKKILILSPFALLIALANLFLEKEIIFRFFSIAVTAGTISFLSIMIRFILTVFASFLLIATTGFYTICFALKTGLHIPSVFVTQLLFLYRYIFILVEESARVVRAYQTRAFKNTIPLKSFGYVTGNLLLRTLNRAERIHTAMLARGFDGRVRINRSLKFRIQDLFFFCGWILFFVTARIFNLPNLLGKLIIEWRI